MRITLQMIRDKMRESKLYHQTQGHVGTFAKCRRAFCCDIREQIGAMEGIRSVQGNTRWRT